MFITDTLNEMSWVKDFRAFAGETSAHGVRNIFEGPNKFVKFLFLVGWIAATIYSCFIIVTSIVTFIDRPTGTKYEVIIDKTEDGSKPQTIKFPTISVCSKNKVKRSFIDAPENALLREYWNLVDMYDKNVLENLEKRFNNKTDEMHSIAGMTYQDLIQKGGPDDSRLLLCSQRTIQCFKLEELSRYYVRENTASGYCWRINPDGKIFGKSGDWGKMTLIFWGDIQDYALRSGDNPSYGYIVAFHDSTTYGSTLHSGYAMSPGTNYKVDLSLKEETREPPPGGNCNKSLTDTSYGAYNEGACVMECKDRHLMKECGCTNVMPPDASHTPDHYKPCTLKQWATCGLREYLNWANAYKDPKNLDVCSCSTACTEISYSAQVSSSSISPAYAKNMATYKIVQDDLKEFSNPALNITYSTPQDIQENTMVVDIMFTSMSTSKIIQVVTYTKNNLLGDIGGVLGLFLGASMFTILEFFQFLIFSAGRHCFGWGKNEPEKLPNSELL